MSDQSGTFAANVLRILVAEGKLGVGDLAFLANRDVATIYRYLGGAEVIPVDVIRAAYEQTGDLRLLKLVAGRRLIKIEEPPSVTAVGEDSRIPGSKDSRAAPRGAPLKSSNPPTLEYFPPTPPRLPPAQQLMEHLAEAIQRTVASAGYAHRILTDNLRDPSDAAALGAFRADCLCLIGLLGDAATLTERHVESQPRRKKVRR